jgi:hypothetical protein
MVRNCVIVQEDAATIQTIEHTRFTRKRPSVKKYDCSPVHEAKQVHEGKDEVCCFPGVKKQTHPGMLSVKLRTRTSCGEKPS